MTQAVLGVRVCRWLPRRLGTGQYRGGRRARVQYTVNLPPAAEQQQSQRQSQSPKLTMAMQRVRVHSQRV